MAQLGDLLITGKTRALNPINGSCTNGTTVTTQTQSTKFLREDGTWSAPSYTAATTDKYHTTGTWSGLTYTATANGGAGALAFTIPTGTTASTVCVGNDSRLSDARTPTSHTHGNIQNGGTLQTTDITIASGDKLVVTDSSDSSKVARTSISFDGSTTTQCLTKKGTWETFGTSNLTIGTTSTTAAAGNHTHNSISPTNGESGVSYKGCTLDYDGLIVGSGSGSALAQYRVKVTSQDITAQDFTWDGTNTSLKTAITTVADRNWYTYQGFNDKTSVAANTTVNMGSFAFTTKGVYLISYVAQFSSNATGLRKLNISTSSTGVDGMDRFGQTTVQACNGAYTHVILTTIETISNDNTTLYFNARHTASAALSITASGIKVMRIR